MFFDLSFLQFVPSLFCYMTFWISSFGLSKTRKRRRSKIKQRCSQLFAFVLMCVLILLLCLFLTLDLGFVSWKYFFYHRSSMFYVNLLFFTLVFLIFLLFCAVPKVDFQVADHLKFSISIAKNKNLQCNCVHVISWSYGRYLCES